MTDGYILNVHRRDPNNVGDYASSAADFLRCYGFDVRTADLFETDNERLVREADAVIFGGGGILDFPDFEPHLARIRSWNPVFVVLGAGHNRHGETRIQPVSWLKDALLVGIRDYIDTYNWVPCPSGMKPIFSNPPSPTRDVVVFSHQRRPLNLGPPAMLNNGSLDASLEHLASGQLVVTNSYHGAYWGTLLGRRVLLVEPFSSKFYGLAWRLPIARSDTWKAACCIARSYPYAYEEAASASYSFVQDLLRELR